MGYQYNTSVLEINIITERVARRLGVPMHYIIASQYIDSGRKLDCMPS